MVEQVMCLSRTRKGPRDASDDDSDDQRDNIIDRLYAQIDAEPDDLEADMSDGEPQADGNEQAEALMRSADNDMVEEDEEEASVYPPVNAKSKKTRLPYVEVISDDNSMYGSEPEVLPPPAGPTKRHIEQQTLPQPQTQPTSMPPPARNPQQLAVASQKPQIVSHLPEVAGSWPSMEPPVFRRPPPFINNPNISRSSPPAMPHHNNHTRHPASQSSRTRSQPPIDVSPSQASALIQQRQPPYIRNPGQEQGQAAMSSRTSPAIPTPPKATSVASVASDIKKPRAQIPAAAKKSITVTIPPRSALGTVTTNVDTGTLTSKSTASGTTGLKRKHHNTGDTGRAHYSRTRIVTTSDEEESPLTSVPPEAFSDHPESNSRLTKPPPKAISHSPSPAPVSAVKVGKKKSANAKNKAKPAKELALLAGPQTSAVQQDNFSATSTGVTRRSTRRHFIQ
ncbi:hypothetical protein CPC08DRAFT_770184 [Agrocybe pediades]|nr:hypothetical protein CPC08DRAFT_770184 [Agrocybe pediades]